MSDQPHEQLLESLLSPEEAAQTEAAGAPPPDEDEDVDALVDDLEALFAESKRVPFGRKLMVDEARALELVDRLRSAIPAEVRRAQRVLDEQDQILGEAREQARRTLHERGLMAELDAERDRMLAQVERDTERMRSDADVYVRGVLTDLADRLARIQASVTNGIEAVSPPAEE